MSTYLEINNNEHLLEITDEDRSAIIISKSTPNITISEQGIPGRDGTTGGWAVYRDSQYNQNNKRLILSNVKTKITNDGSASLSSEVYKPSGSIWWNKQTSVFVPDKYADIYSVRINLKLSPVINNRTITLELNQGTTSPPVSQDLLLSRGADTEYKLSFNFMFIASTALINNSGTIYITCNSDLYLWDVSFLVVKIFEDVT